MSPISLWLTMIAAGLLTYAIRLSFIVTWGRVTPPPALQRALRFVPPAVLSAIIFPGLLRPDGPLDLSPGNARLPAGIVAALIAWRTRNTLLTIAAGLAALWGLQALMARL